MGGCRRLEGNTGDKYYETKITATPVLRVKPTQDISLKSQPGS
jgi:hypothetical protein